MKLRLIQLISARIRIATVEESLRTCTQLFQQQRFRFGNPLHGRAAATQCGNFPSEGIRIAQPAGICFNPAVNRMLQSSAPPHRKQFDRDDAKLAKRPASKASNNIAWCYYITIPVTGQTGDSLPRISLFGEYCT